jgi:hypothetical protein
MGQDMCIMTLCHRKGVVPNLDNALKFIDHLTTIEIENIDWGQDYGWDELETDGRPMSDILADVQDILRRAIGDVFDSLNWRDVTWIQVNGWQVHITGGMDGGTESFDVWSRIHNDYGTLGWEVLQAAGFENPPSDAEPYKIEEEASIHD